MIEKIQNPKIRQIYTEIQNLPTQKCEVEFKDVISINFNQNEALFEKACELAKALKPWRKGPFELKCGEKTCFIDSEWQSFIKYNSLAKYFDLNGKIVGDIGCNNGYYAMRFKHEGAKRVIGVEPSGLFLTQFWLMEKFAGSGVEFEVGGVEDLPQFSTQNGVKFDTLFCLGVLYHRSDPILTLKWLKNSLANGGELFLDTMFIEGEEAVALCPAKSYSKIPNISFVPTIKALQNWCERAGFKDFELLFTKQTTQDEQRKTQWIEGESLAEFLDENDKSKTVEGYPAPQRVYVRLGR